MFKLPFYDRIERESEEYWELDIIDQEVILEVSDPNFQKVIDRLESKGKSGNLMILKLNEVRKLRTKRGQRFKNMMDLSKDGQHVVDSQVLAAAQRIEEFLLYKRERHAMLMRLRKERGTHEYANQGPQLAFEQ